MMYHLSQLSNLLVLAFQLFLKLGHFLSIQKFGYSFLVLFKDTLPYFFLPDLFDALLFGVFSFKLLFMGIKVVFVKIFADLFFHSIVISGIDRLIASERVLIVEIRESL